MFDVGFSELVLVFIVGLIVLGPKRLPIAIRTVMGWVRTIRGLAANVQNELAQELKLQELQESIKKAESLNLKSLSPELAQTVDELKSTAEKMKSELEQQVKDVNHIAQQQVEQAKALDEIESPLEQTHSQDSVELADDSSSQLEQEDNLDLVAQKEAEIEKMLAAYAPDESSIVQHKNESV